MSANLLVGRESELALLRGALNGATNGRGRLVLVGGEAGVGKTRLLRELVVDALASGVEVAQAACWAGPAAPTFWPWAQIVRVVAAVGTPACPDGSTAAYRPRR